MRRHAATVLVALAAATSVLGSHASSVSAECMYLPPWPPITDAIPTAQVIVIGEVVAATEADLRLGPDQGPRDRALWITHVLRGRARPGDLLDIQYLLPNWPQTQFDRAFGPTPSCTYLRTAPREVIALALDALRPGGRMQERDQEWIQPPTRYNAVGVLAGPVGEVGTDDFREPVTLPRLLDLATIPRLDPDPPPPPSPDGTNLLLLTALIGTLLGTLLALRRSTISRRWRQKT